MRIEVPNNLKLSPHLTFREAIRSNTATRHGVLNRPTAEQLLNMHKVSNQIFEPSRDFVGGPLFVTSLFRSLDVNSLIGGSKSSYHLKALAIDLDCDVFGGKTNAELFHFIKDNLNFHQLIWEFGTDENPNWVHVAIKQDPKKNEKIILKAIRKGGRTKYVKMAS